VVKVFGRQTFKIGFDGRQYRLSVKNFGNTEGGFNFGNQFFGTTNGTTAFSPTFGGDLASFLLGLPTAGDDDINTRADYHSYYIGSFLQDDWRVNDRLTVNLGIRYDVDTPFREKFGRTVNGFNPLATNTASPFLRRAAARFTTTTAAS
jgi:outer membrane receptor protein involved in Fe transport